MQKKLAAVPSFDDQAVQYNKRTGFSKSLCLSVANAVYSLTSELTLRRVVEIGCGTGQIGSELHQISDTYVGLDVSEGMLNEFRQHYPYLNEAIRWADGRNAWPVETNSTNIVFSSRALHWLDIDHAVKESYRVGYDGLAYLIVGRIERSKGSLQRKLRKQLHGLLLDNGLEPRDGQQHLKRLRAKLVNNKATVLEPVIASAWQDSVKLEKLIGNWSDKEGLAGTLLPVELKNSILKELKQWAKQNLDETEVTQHSYTLYGFKLTG